MDQLASGVAAIGGVALLAAALLAAALLAVAWLALRRRRRDTRGALDFAGMNDRAFESLVADAFRSQGYQPVQAPHGKLADAVGQLMFRRDRTTFLIECRHWKVGKVGVDAIHALQRTMAARGVSAGFAVTAGRFSREAITLAGGCGIRLLDGPALRAIVRR